MKYSSIGRAQAESRLRGHRQAPSYYEDVRPLVSPEEQLDLGQDADLVSTELLSRLPGDPWKGFGDLTS